MPGSKERPLTIAVAKGRLLEPGWEVLKQAGLVKGEPPTDLLVSGRDARTRLLIARGPDVVTYVAAGVASLGMVGKDVLLEKEPDLIVHELADLHYGRCRISLAVPVERADAPLSAPGGKPLRVATKFPRLTRDYFQAQGMGVAIVPLHGAVEVAPSLGLADVIVDIVSSGRTLQRHGMVEVATITQVTSRLIGHAGALRSTASETFWPLVTAMEQAGQRVAGAAKYSA
ncbi:MAG: ATP phosphoribosyltransferase [Thermaerobacterales bacterium]